MWGVVERAWGPTDEDRFNQNPNLIVRELHVIAYRAALDVPEHTVTLLYAGLAAHQRRLDTRCSRHRGGRPA